MKKALVFLLVVVVVATGLPVILGMSGMASCVDCQPGLAVAFGCTLAVLAAAFALSLVVMSQRLRARRDSMPFLLHSFLLERPPRLA